MVGNSARFYPASQMGAICRGGPNDEPPNVWSWNGTLALGPIQAVPGPSQRAFSIATGILVGTLPKGAWIESVEVSVLTPFNAGGNNTLLCGTVNADTPQASLPATFNNLVASGDVNATVVGNTVCGRNLGPGLALSADQDVYIQFQQTGAPATQGNAMLVITFAPTPA